jgi:hypothetical protein
MDAHLASGSALEILIKTRAKKKRGAQHVSAALKPRNFAFTCRQAQN